MKEPLKEPDRTTIANLSKIYLTGMGGATNIGKEDIVKKKAMYLPVKPGSGADFRYSGNEITDTEENRRAKRCSQKKKSDKKPCGGKCVYRRNTVTHLTRGKAILMMIAATNLTRRRVKGVTAKQRTIGEHPDEMEILTRTVPLETLSLH